MNALGTLTWVAILILVVGLFLLVRNYVRSRRGGPASPQDAYTLGLSALISGDRREAMRQLKEAVQGDSDNLDAYIRLGDLLRESGEVQKAMAVHRDLTVRSRLSEGNRARILESLTQDYLTAGRFEEAGQSAERLHRLDRQNRFAYRALQQVAEALKDWPRAVKVVEERARIENHQDKSVLARYRGFVGSEELAAGNTKAAKQHFEEALKLDPACTLAYLYLGDMEQAAGNTEKAVEHWRTLALESPENGKFVFDRLERAFFEMGHYGDVISFYREFLHRSPREDAVAGLLALAEIHRRKGDLDEAEAFLQEATEIEPDHPRAYRHLIKVAMDRKDPQAALNHVEGLLETLEGHEDAVDCRHCGRALEGPQWRCPHCKGLNPLGI
jgi:lipopolysaccharide biosynthesis regulator YciM